MPALLGAKACEVWPARDPPECHLLFWRAQHRAETVATFLLSSAQVSSGRRLAAGPSWPSLLPQGPHGEVLLRAVFQGKSGLATLVLTRDVTLGISNAG